MTSTEEHQTHAGMARVGGSALPCFPAFHAAIFDMDGVITKTASVHSRAWKRMFDEYLLSRKNKYGEPFREFTHAGDYLAYVDGRPRLQGISTFLASRGINLALGCTDDEPGSETIWALGNRKNGIFLQILQNEGAELYDSSISLIEELRRLGVRVGLATSSRNSEVILGATGTSHLFATIVDGIVSQRLGLKGKPEPDIFTKAAANLGVPCSQAIVVEDAVTGVEAGARGGFGLVIGVARENNERELSEHGADVVVRDLSEIAVEEINRLIIAKRSPGPVLGSSSIHNQRS